MKTDQEQASRTHVVVGVDGSELSRAALLWAFDYASARGLTVRAVHAWTYPVAHTATGEYLLVDADMAADALVLVQRVVNEVLGDAARFVELEAPFGTPGPMLVERSRGAELLVVGASGGNPLIRLLVGSTTAYVAQHAPCPVVVFRPDGRQPVHTPAPTAAAGVTSE